MAEKGNEMQVDKNPFPLANIDIVPASRLANRLRCNVGGNITNNGNLSWTWEVKRRRNNNRHEG